MDQLFDQLLPHWVEHILAVIAGLCVLANAAVAILPTPKRLARHVSQSWLRRYTVVLIFIQSASLFRKRWNQVGDKP